MTIDQFRRDQIDKARANRDDQIDRHESDRDAAIGAAWHDYTAHCNAANAAFRRAVDAISCGEFDADHEGDAA